MQKIIATLLFSVSFLSPRPDSSPALAGIAHVAFRVSDVEKSREFYRALGFEQAFEFKDPGKPEVSYIKINDHQFIELYGRADDPQPTGLLHVCYEAADIESLWNEYVKSGLNPPPSRKAHAGLQSISEVDYVVIGALQPLRSPYQFLPPWTSISMRLPIAPI